MFIDLCPSGMHLLHNEGDSYCVYVTGPTVEIDCAEVASFCADFMGGDATPAIMSTTTLIHDYDKLLSLYGNSVCLDSSLFVLLALQLWEIIVA